MAPVSLQHASSPVVVIDERFCQASTTRLKLRENHWSISGDDIAVTDMLDGRAILECKGKVFSHKARLFGADGREVAMLRECCSFSKSVRIEGPGVRVQVLTCASMWVSCGAVRCLARARCCRPQAVNSCVTRASWRYRCQRTALERHRHDD
jgi:hypothetical protein